MTSTASGRSRCFMDFNNQKNQEWLRRRRMRLEQVRRQSNEIAKALRERIFKDEKARLDEFDKLSNARFRDWKAERLEELEKKLRWALEQFGQSYRLAEEESDPEEIIRRGYKINMAKAQKRGEIAEQKELRMKKMTEEKKILPILRKQLTRKKEDLRSALLRSVPLKKQLSEMHEFQEENIYFEKTPVKKKRKRKVSPPKCRHKTASKSSGSKVWINLNELQCSSTGESGLEAKSSKSSTTVGKDRPEGMVEFYDFSSRYHSKSFKEFPHLIEKIETTNDLPNANELAQLEGEMEKFDSKKRLEADAISQERGLEALRKEKIQREYYKLIARLEELNRKEKVLKVQQRDLPDFFHMTDDRLSERERTKQRIMDTKFESIYYAAIEQIPKPQSSLPEFSLYQGGGDYVESDERTSTKLSFSSSNLKLNTPVTSSVEDSMDSSSHDLIRRKKKTKKKKQLLVDIDNTLKMGRELRKTIYGNPGSKSEEEKEKEPKKSISDIVTQTDAAFELQNRNERKMTKSQESQTEELQEIDLKAIDKVYDSIPPSSATSYKSPPSVFKPYSLDFLDYLEGISETEDIICMRNKPEVDVSSNNSLLLGNEKSGKVDKAFESPTLEYYIEKLLNMSRECIANLSVSSENFSTPNVTDSDALEVQTSEAEYFIEEVEDFDRKPKLKRVGHLEETIRSWKPILEKNSEKSSSELEVVPEDPQTELSDYDAEIKKAREPNVTAVYHPEIQNRYEEITKKCSERILKLSKMLKKVKKDKEKLLVSCSSLSLTEEKEPFEAEEDEGTQPSLGTPLKSLAFEEYTKGNSSGGDGDLASSWDDESTSPTHNISVSESSGSEQQDHESDHELFQKDFEFVKKHAGDADPEFLMSLLHSEISNPRRLESVMCEVLNIPNSEKLIREFRRDPVKAGDKRSIVDSNSQPDKAKKKKTKNTEIYLNQMRDMFPDADGLFLISECQQLESWEDFSRFVNTVMLSGVYPKKGALDYASKAEPSRVVDIINMGDYRTSESFSSEEEISSSGLTETPRKRRRRKIPSTNEAEKNGNLLSAPEIDVIDLASDNTEPYDPSDNDTLQAFLDGSFSLKDEVMEVEEVIPEQASWETSFVNIIDDILQTKFGDEKLIQKTAVTPAPGPSGVPARPISRQTLPVRASFDFDDSISEVSLAEIIEGKRNHRRKSAPSPVGVDAKPSTSKADSQRQKHLLKKLIAEVGSEVSSPEVSTTYQPTRHRSETDGGLEDGDDASKVSEEWIAEQTANLIRIFPNTDPSYLREEVVKMNGCTATMNEFVIVKLERNDMPSRAEYEKKLEMEELQNRFTKNFSIEDFLKAVPDPWAYFTQGNRNCAKYKSHSLCYLKSTFRKRFARDIVDTFNANNCNLYLSYQELKKEGSKVRGSRRSEFECNHNRPTTIDIQFLQEVAFIENEEKIRDYIEGEKLARQIKFDEAKRTGSLLECQCCFDAEVMVEDIFYCPKDHAFCKDCIVRSVEVEMGYGRFKFECLTNCEEKFTLACLQNVLKPELFSKVIQAIQMEEIRAAGIEDLVQCPFCNYATIMPPEEKVMTCLNPECLKESCRLCKELNHIPLRCDEVEKSEEVKMRTYIENKMTEALVRTCYKCGKKFVKEDGCNKMTCTCGAKMCYVCRRPVSDYSHFNGQGGTEYHKCPLYSTNDELHVDLVKMVGEEAKAEIMQANPNTKLLYDPTVLPPERTHQAPMPGMNNHGAALNVAMRAIRGVLNQEEGEADTQRHNRDRREIRREANPYYNRYHHHHYHHRQRAYPETANGDRNQQRQPQYHHHHHHHNNQQQRQPQHQNRYRHQAQGQLNRTHHNPNIQCNICQHYRLPHA